MPEKLSSSACLTTLRKNVDSQSETSPYLEQILKS